MALDSLDHATSSQDNAAAMRSIHPQRSSLPLFFNFGANVEDKIHQTIFISRLGNIQCLLFRSDFIIVAFLVNDRGTVTAVYNLALKSRRKLIV